MLDDGRFKYTDDQIDNAFAESTAALSGDRTKKSKLGSAEEFLNATKDEEAQKMPEKTQGETPKTAQGDTPSKDDASDAAHDDDDALDELERGSSRAAKLESLRGGSGGQDKSKGSKLSGGEVASPAPGKKEAKAKAKGKAAKAKAIKPAEVDKARGHFNKTIRSASALLQKALGAPSFKALADLENDIRDMCGVHESRGWKTHASSSVRMSL